MAPPADTTSLLRELAHVLEQHEAPVRPLGDARYVDAHRAFEQASSQQAQIRQRIEAEAQRLVQPHGSPLDVLSVGCGCGLLDRPLLTHLADEIASFTGVDPNPTAVAHCRRAVGTDRLPPSHVDCARLADFEPSQRYDLIYCSHVFYYVDDRAAALRKMRSMLQPDGTLVIVHAPKAALNTLAQVFWGEHTQSDFFTQDLQRLLQTQCPSSPVTHSISAHIPRPLFSGTAPQDTLLLEFLLQAEWAPLPARAKTLVHNYLDQHARSLTAETDVLPHPATVLSLRDAALDRGRTDPDHP